MERWVFGGAGDRIGGWRRDNGSRWAGGAGAAAGDGNGWGFAGVDTMRASRINGADRAVARPAAEPLGSLSRVEGVRIPVGDVALNGDLTLPSAARGLVLFAHGSGSSRHSSRNQLGARELNLAGMATLLFDLLTEDEEYEERYTRHLRFDIGLRAERVVTAPGGAGPGR